MPADGARPLAMHLLTINAGSSSIRVAAFAQSDVGLVAVARYRGEDVPTRAVEILRSFLREHDIPSVSAVAHRVVHGGDRDASAHLVDDELEQAIADLGVLAPLHNPAALAWLRAARQVLGPVPHFALFDTALYADLPPVARTYALPAALTARHGLRRYGFHGLAHGAMLARFRHIDRGTCVERVLSLQLGSGCSITAFRSGRAIDTSMGFSPLEGLMMATRAGDLDPGLILHLQRTLGVGLDRLDRMLHEESGLAGVSAVSGDMRVLLASDAPHARLAVELYAYRARKYVGAFMAALGGADAILFGGGVGEHSPTVRAAILRDMEWAGVRLDAAANAAAESGDIPIHANASRVRIWTVTVDEEALLAHAAAAAIAGTAPQEDP